MKISKKMGIGKFKFLTEYTEDTEDFLKEEESSHSQSSPCTPKLCEDIKKPPQKGAVLQNPESTI